SRDRRPRPGQRRLPAGYPRDRRGRGRPRDVGAQRHPAARLRRRADRRDRDHERARALAGARPAPRARADGVRERRPPDRGLVARAAAAAIAGEGLLMLAKMRRPPFPVEAFFRHSLVLTYAYPEEVLRPFLPRGLTLDVYEGWGFLAIALVQTEALRPAGWPKALGRDFFLSGYRVFSRYRRPDGGELRGLRILRSDA